ncbi:hypothetical protein BHU72_13650 [Desulfuribacillus stibiiarsenatis]|uniref:Uncharacterized protein n=1 Tax=Desulfuribacillus stibiiarsenatis TaxID=1390249 RepID=A0A1E5L8S3_9FIRM|nr:hypothetical protein [Desulfuribacillus stibiiarsenatis]OEH86458.1 hypothetical protein BHU72_13650 [Desulfuribacillus stibiiarsenatis]
MKKFFVFLLIGCSSLLLITSSIMYENNKTNNSRKIIVSQDQPVSNNIDDIISSVEYVVIGEYTNFQESWNMARSKDRKKGADDVVVTGRLYDFKVDEYIKGIDKSRILVNLLYSYSDKIIGLENEIVDDYYYQPIIGEKVVLFLNKDKVFNNFYPAIHPYEYIVGDDHLRIKTKNKVISDTFINKELSISVLKEKTKIK